MLWFYTHKSVFMYINIRIYINIVCNKSSSIEEIIETIKRLVKNTCDMGVDQKMVLIYPVNAQVDKLIKES